MGIVRYSLAVCVLTLIIASYFWFYRHYGLGFCIGTIWMGILAQIGAYHKFGEFID